MLIWIYPELGYYKALLKKNIVLPIYFSIFALNKAQYRIVIAGEGIILLKLQFVELQSWRQLRYFIFTAHVHFM